MPPALIRPDHCPRAADRTLPPLGLAAAAGFCAAVWADERVLERTPVYFGAGLVGIFAARLVHRYRSLGLVPIHTTVATVVGLVAMLRGEWPGWAVAVFPCGLGLAAGGVLRFRDTVRTDPRHHGLLAAAGAVAAIGTAVAFTQHADPVAFGWLAVVASAVTAALAWPTLFRPFFEHVFCFVARVVYWPRAVGPGVAKFPRSGPALVIANHGDMFDPVLVGGMMPRQVTGVMTAAYFDKPGLAWLMRVFGTIRVPEIPVRREAPEIDAAVQALDAGRVVMLFPEGYLRRKEEVPLKRFGQGVWKMLDARPDTLVVPVWIEGTWGSIFSWKGGPPFKGKRFRPFRRITVSVGEPQVVPPEVLRNRMGTRLYLMQKVADQRAAAGFDPLPPVDQLPRDDGKDDA
jgi:1-acyl-sn-glycerol-3-phosphate acyltransferase